MNKKSWKDNNTLKEFLGLGNKERFHITKMIFTQPSKTSKGHLSTSYVSRTNITDTLTETDANSIEGLKKLFKNEVLKFAKDIINEDYLKSIKFSAFGKPDNSEITLMASLSHFTGAGFTWMAIAKKV
jgi:hypothetical protein